MEKAAMAIRTKLSATLPRRLAGTSGALAGQSTGGGTADLWIVDSAGRRIDVIWPAGFHARPNPIRLVDAQGQDVANAGSSLRLTGGYVPEGAFSANEVVPVAQ